MSSPTPHTLTAAVATFTADRYPDLPVVEGATLTTLWGRLRAAGVTSPGDEFADWVDLGLIGGVLLPLFVNCPDLETAVRALARYHPLVDDAALVVLDEQRSGALDLIIADPGGGRPDPDSVRAFSRLLEHLVARLAGPVPAPRRIDDGLRFPADLLAKPIRTADPRIAMLLTPMAEGSLADRSNEVVADVRAAIRATGVQAAPSLGDVAAELAHSPRSLQQRLANGGTSYSRLVDEERRATALALLADPNRPVTEIAFATGYGSVEGFGRAVRRWTGLTPTRWRRRHLPSEG